MLIFAYHQKSQLAKVGLSQKITLLLQCAITQEQSLAIVARTGDATQGTIIGSAEFKLTTDQDNIIYKIPPLLNHPISDNKSYFYTYQIDLSCIFSQEDQKSLFSSLFFEPNTFVG